TINRLIARSLALSLPAPPLAGDQVPVSSDEHLPEAWQVEADVLAIEVDLLGDVPAALADAGGVGEHGVAGGVLAGEGALLGEDLVADVAEAEARRRLAVVGAGGPVGAERHDLDEHLARAHEEEVGHGGAVHAHHGVAGVELPVYLAQLGGALGADHAHVEADVRGERGDVRLVLDHAGPRARHDHQTRPVRRRRRGLLRRRRHDRQGDGGGGGLGRGGAALAAASGAALEPLEVLDAAAVGVVEERPEVADALALRRLLGIDGELAVDAQAGDHLREAVHAAVGGEVDRRERREAGHDVAVLGHPPVVVLEDDEHHAAAEVVRRHEQRQDPVVELVVHVARVPARGEHHGGHVVHDVAPRRAAGGHATEPHLVDRRHDVRLPLARVRPYPLLLHRRRRRVPGRRRHELERRARRVHPHVAAREADVRPRRRPVTAKAIIPHARARRRGDLHRTPRRRGRATATLVGVHEGEERHGRHEQRPNRDERQQQQPKEAAHAERPRLRRLAVLAGAAAAVVVVVVHDTAAGAGLGRRRDLACDLLILLALPEL
ncbi:Os07g0657300, partial [Oryza sativa Japonica Group]